MLYLDLKLPSFEAKDHLTTPLYIYLDVIPKLHMTIVSLAY